MNYTIAAPATADDVKDDLLRLMRSNFPWGHQAQEWFRWGYEQSPFRPNVCWLAETDTRERIGFTTLMPRRMKVGAEIRETGQAANLNVTAEHRSGLAAVKLQRAVLSHLDRSEMALAFGITRNAAAVLSRAGYRDLGGFSRWIKYFRTEHKLAQWIPWKWPRRAAAAVLDLGLRLRAADTYRRLPRGWSVLMDPPFDDQFDALWQASASNFTVITERTSEYLRWRFGSDPQQEYRVFAVADAQGQIRGAAVYLFPEPGESQPLGGIVDLLSADQQAGDALLGALCQHLRRQGATGVQMIYFGSEFIEKSLQRCNFIRRESEFRVLAHLHPSLKDRQAELLAPSCWHITEAEAKF